MRATKRAHSTYLRRETSDTLRARDSELLAKRYAERRKEQEDEKARAIRAAVSERDGVQGGGSCRSIVAR